MPQAVDNHFYHMPMILVFQYKDIKTIEEHLTRDFSTLIHWLVNNKLSLYFCDDKTKSILFSPKHRLRIIGQIDIFYKGVKIKQYYKVTFLDVPCMHA